MHTSDSMYDSTTRSATTLAAIFVDRESAHDALANLHHAGYTSTWLGVTRTDGTENAEPTVETEGSGGFLASVGRFFSGEGENGQALHAALVRNGVSEAEALRIDGAISPGDAIVTVRTDNKPDEAMRILSESGGEFSPAGQPALPRTSNTNAVDDESVLRLHEERLAIDKRQVSGGEVRVGTTVKSQTQSVDVPVFHEELYIERRPVGAASAGSVDETIGEGREIRIPLTAERLDVSKRTVVTDEIVVGKRRVSENQHVSETLRREELDVEDSAGTSSDRRLP